MEHDKKGNHFTLSIPVLIIGGGISGITAAIELAEAGQEVVVIEKEPYLGGNVSGFNNYFPKMCPPACGLEINYRRIRSNSRVSYFTGAEVVDISGVEGDFSVTISLAARLINNRCTACGKCAEVCPVERKNKPFGRPGTKAAYIPGGLAFPMKFTIDEEVCEKESCAKCLEVCQYDAIQLEASPGEIFLQVRKIILATGWHPYDASRIENYHYSDEPDVVTNLEFEHLLASCTGPNQKLLRPSNGLPPERIAFIQCAGSRDQNHLPYCSSVCCSASLKHALTLADHYPEMKSEIFYIDLRVTGRNEKLLQRVQSTPSISLTKGKVGRIQRDTHGGGLVLAVEDIMAGIKRQDPFDMVVLATGLVPNLIEGIPLAMENGFYGAVQKAGIIPAATCKRPMDVASSVRDATAAGLKALQT